MNWKPGYLIAMLSIQWHEKIYCCMSVCGRWFSSSRMTVFSDNTSFGNTTDRLNLLRLPGAWCQVRARDVLNILNIIPYSVGLRRRRQQARPRHFPHPHRAYIQEHHWYQLQTSDSVWWVMFQCTIWSFHCGDYEELRLRGCDAVWLL
jgi:hypothetical protein